MANKFGFSEEELIKIRPEKCVYCHKIMLYPYDRKNHKDSATIEHLREVKPFYVRDGLKIEDVSYCCGSCNSSRGKKKLLDWFKTEYCIDKKINEHTVTEPVKKYLQINNLTS